MNGHATWLGEPTPSQQAALEAWGEQPRPHILLFGVDIGADYLTAKLIIQSARVEPGIKEFTLHRPDGGTENVRLHWDDNPSPAARANGYYRLEKP